MTRRFSRALFMNMSLAATFFCFSGCDDNQPGDPQKQPISSLDSVDVNHHLIVVGRDGNKVRARGFTGSVPKGSTVNLQVNRRSTQVVANENGRFDVAFAVEDYDRKSESATITVTSSERSESSAYRIRDIDAALGKIAGPAVKTGAVPNDLLLAYHQERPFAFVPASMAAEMQVFPLDQTPSNGMLKDAKTLHLMPDAHEAPANPWSMALSADTQYAAVSLQGQHKVVLIDPWQQKALSYGEVRDRSGEYVLFDVKPAAQLRDKIDATRKGSSDFIVDKMAARHPQGLLFVGDHLLVTFTNLLEIAQGVDKPASFGPGILARFKRNGDQLELVDTLTLPCTNPTHLVKDLIQQLWVVCSGVFAFDASGKFTLSNPAALLKLGNVNARVGQGLHVEHAIDFGTRFAPGQPAFTKNDIIVGNTIGPEIVIVSQSAKSISEGQAFALANNAYESAYLPSSVNGFGNLIWVTDFLKDRIVVVDVERGEINPWPFSNGIPVSKNSRDGAARGPHAIALRQGRPGVDYRGADAFVVLNLSAELVPLSMMELMGP